MNKTEKFRAEVMVLLDAFTQQMYPSLKDDTFSGEAVEKFIKIVRSILSLKKG